jgi:hypothetical protein
MDKRSAIALMFALAAPAAEAQSPIQTIHGSYMAKLSGFCRSITERDASSGPWGDFRVRRGASLNASGNRHAIFIDDGASAVITGQSNVIFVAKGGQATIGGKRNQVFFEPGGRVTVVGQAMIASVAEIDLRVNPNADECQ